MNQKQKIYERVYNNKTTIRKTLRLKPSNNDFIENLAKELGITYTNTLNLIIESFILDTESEDVENVSFIGRTV